MCEGGGTRGEARGQTGMRGWEEDAFTWYPLHGTPCMASPTYHPACMVPPCWYPPVLPLALPLPHRVALPCAPLPPVQSYATRFLRAMEDLLVPKNTGTKYVRQSKYGAINDELERFKYTRGGADTERSDTMSETQSVVSDESTHRL